MNPHGLSRGILINNNNSHFPFSADSMPDYFSTGFSFFSASAFSTLSSIGKLLVFGQSMVSKWPEF